jgi:hypothetical protein
MVDCSVHQEELATDIRMGKKLYSCKRRLLSVIGGAENVQMLQEFYLPLVTGP